MLFQKPYFIPLNVSLWLQDIRKTSEEDEDATRENILKCRHAKMNSSNDSIYDNVDSLAEEADFKKHTFFDKEITEDMHSTWPLRKCGSKKLQKYSLEDLFKYELWEGEANAVSRQKDDFDQTISFNFLKNKLSTVRRDITCGRKVLSESESQEREEPNLCALMSNLLASHREKHTQECSGTCLNAEKIIFNGPGKDVQFSKILRNTENDRIHFEKRIRFLQEDNRGSGNFIALDNSLESPKTSKYRKFYPAGFSGFDVNGVFECDFVADKPPLAPRNKKKKMTERFSPQFSLAKNRRLRKAHFGKGKPVAVPTVQLRTKTFEMDFLEKKDSDDFKNGLLPCAMFESAVIKKDEFVDKEKKKPLPFPAHDPELEYEISELLMMQKVTESSKERRRICTDSKAPPILEESNNIFQGFVKNIPEARPLPISIQASYKSRKEKSDDVMSLCDFIRSLSTDIVDKDSKDKVRQFLMSRKNKLKCHVKPQPPLKLREDIIIDWENDYENLNEPVILEGKSIFRKIPDVPLRPKIFINSESDWQSLETSISKDWSDDEIYEKTMQYFDSVTNSVSTEEICSIISDSSLPTQSNVEENRQGARNRKVKSDITEIVTRYDKILKESDPKCDTETSDKISFSSFSDGLNSYSDFESDVNDTIAIGDIWCSEKVSEENASIISWEVSEDASKSSAQYDDDDDDEDNHEDDISDHSKSWKLYKTTIEHNFETTSGNIFPELKLDTIAENDDKSIERNSDMLEENSNKKSFVKSSSEPSLNKLCLSKPPLEKVLSKSLGFFRDYSTDKRLELNVILKKHNSITSDVCEWMTIIRGIAFAEDQLFSNDEEWILSFDSEERAYFFEESSKKSLWALPDYSRENTKAECNYSIQRSATESAINNETSTKLRLNKDGGQSRISASTRSSKAQSMLIEPKLEISPKDGNKTFSMPRDLSKIYGEIIRIGVLNKTKILENGKKLRKNWTPSFIVLTDSYLFFFKDAKSFQNMKHVIGSSSNHMCLSLQGAVIEKGDKISSRKNVYKISCSDNTEVLIQTEKPSDAEEWFKEIITVIQKLPQDSAIRGSPLSDSKSPSKVGRTKSLKVRSKDTGSMEDLSSTPEERQNKIKARLKKFFIRRPTVDSLKKKGIWKDEPVFGCSLEQITKNRNPRVPVFVEKCVEFIESKEENMKTDGLYRASGNLSQVQKIRLEVDQNNLNIMKEEEDVHVLTGSLKLFFRELKEPLIPSKQLEPALLATDKHARKERIKDFQKIVKSLPTPNYDTLKFLLQHLLRVKEYHKFNRMNINNLAIVFGPTLMWPEQESANMALELMQQNVVIECLLKEFQEIFT